MCAKPSFAISLAVLLAIIDLTVDGFTLPRSQNASEVIHELDADASTLLEVKNDLIRPNHNKIAIDKKEDLEKIKPIQLVATEEAKSENTKHIDKTFTRNEDIKHEMTKMRVADINATTTKPKLISSKLNRFKTTQIPVAESDNELNKDKTITSEEFISTSEISTVTLQNEIVTTATPEENKIKTRTIHKTTDDKTGSLESTESLTVKVDNENLVTTESVFSGSTATLPEVSTTSEIPSTYQTITESNSEDMIGINTSTQTKITHSDSTNTEDRSTTNPPWKKYNIIERIRTNNTATDKSIPTSTKFDKGADMVNAHTIESRIRLETAFGIAPDILSLQQLKNDLLDNTSKAQSESPRENISPLTTSNQTLGTTFKETTLPMSTSKLNKVEIMSSKRAGFLDHTKFSTKADTTTGSYTSKPEKETELDAAAYDVDNVENERVENKTTLESQSQLTEDAIKEELLKEAMIEDNEQNSIRYRTSKDEHPAAVEDSLSVKPISPDRIKSTTLYAVNPNYKPLKKIEVQPPKSFVRDPDDNSWRNESLSSLGIVFKGKNSSKAFTEVLKNKTETVMSNIPDKDSTIGPPELRERLEKIAEKRKFKKKKVDQFGNTEYADYEENNSSGDNTPISKISSPVKTIPPISSSSHFSSLPPTQATETMTRDAISEVMIIRNRNLVGTEKPKKVFNLQDYYDSGDEEDSEYAKFTNMDIKKSTGGPNTDWPVTKPPAISFTTKANQREYIPDRKPTVQYFPPRPKPSPNVNVNEYDSNFQNKINMFSIKSTPKSVLPVSQGTIPPRPIQNDRITTNRNLPTPPQFPRISFRPEDVDKDLHFTHAPRPDTINAYGAGNSDENFHRNPYVIRHYKDMIDAAVKDNEYDRNAYIYSGGPAAGVTLSDPVRHEKVKSNPDYEYEFRKDVLDRFVENFNQNQEQFRNDFPVLFNTSIVHKGGPDEGKVLASSSAMFKRLYDSAVTRPESFLGKTKAYDPNCENVTVELSPAYELHYYVPEQEEREEIESKAIPLGYRV